MLTITVDITAGCSIEDAFKDAIALADKLNCYIDFKFNDVQCSANPGTSAAYAAQMYYRVIKDESIKYKFVIS